MSKLILVYEKNIDIKSFQPIFMNFNFLVKLAKEFSGLKEKEIILKFELENKDFRIIRNDKDIKKFIEIFEDRDVRVEIFKNNNFDFDFHKVFDDCLENKDNDFFFKNIENDIFDDKIERIDKIIDIEDDNESIHKMLKKFKRLKISENINSKEAKKIKKIKKKKKLLKKNKKLKNELFLIKEDLKEFISAPNPTINYEISNYKYQIEKILKKIIKKDKKKIKEKKKVKDITLDIKTIHNNVACNSCEILPIIGKRFKCLVCYNFDYCENCEKKFYHSHPMIRMVEKMDHQFSNYIDKINLELDKKENKKIQNEDLIVQKKELLEFMFGSISNSEKNKLVEKYKDTNIEEFYKILTKT